MLKISFWRNYKAFFLNNLFTKLSISFRLKKETKKKWKEGKKKGWKKEEKERKKELKIDQV